MTRLLLAFALCFPLLAQAETDEIRITKQPGIIYLAPIVMEQQKLIEREAAKLGLPELKARWMTFGGGGAATDALLSGNVDVVTTGPSNMLLLWDRTRGQIKGLASSAATPLWLVTSRPEVKTLKDFTPQDKIAVPTVKVSTQAILLQMAAQSLYGPANWDHFDKLEVTLSHPDAMAALINRNNITAHFGGPPYQNIEAKTPGLQLVITSGQIMGQPLSIALYFSHARFHDANPTVVKAFLAAAQAASDYIAAHPREACELYLQATGEKFPVDLLLQSIGDPKTTFTLTPYGITRFIDHMTQTKVLKTKPASWKDVFFPEAAGMAGN